MNELKAHRLEAIRALREEYNQYGDAESTKLCDLALSGDESAYAEMLEVVTDTTHGGASEEELAEFRAMMSGSCYDDSAMAEAYDRDRDK